MARRNRAGVLLATFFACVAFALVGGHHALAAKDAPASHVITIEGMKFSPDAVRVHVGDRIEFKNADLVPHTATAKGANGFDSGLIKAGESWTFAPTKPGSLNYACSFHPTMTGRIVVVGEK
jgi:plastocyanin